MASLGDFVIRGNVKIDWWRFKFEKFVGQLSFHPLDALLDTVASDDGDILQVALSLDLSQLQNVNDFKDGHAAFDVLLVGYYQEASIFMEVFVI